MTNYAQHFAKRGPTPQTSPLPGRAKEQVKNNAGGYVFRAGDWEQLDRFLILGATGSYYATPRAMTIDNAECVLRCLASDGPRVVARIVEISDAGRAPKNDPALFALALCAAADDLATRRDALAALPKVARIGTHLFKFVEFVQAQRGWGRSLRNAIGEWYNRMPLDRLVMQAVKYQQREGWSNRDLLRLSHPVAADGNNFGGDPMWRESVYDWICGRKSVLAIAVGEPTALLRAYDHLKTYPTSETAADVIRNHRMPREGIPTELLNDVSVWKALLEDMPLTAMVRNLGKMTSIGAISGLDHGRVKAALGDRETIRKARLHPLALLVALKTYAQGHGEKGKLSWDAIPQVIEALDGAFYKSFETVVPTGKRILLALDVSGSMGGAAIAGMPLTAREASAALALVTAATEENYLVVGFCDKLTPLAIGPRQRLDDVIKTISRLNFGSTDCALPWIWAMQNDIEIDAVVTITDNETYEGRMHVTEAVKRYRDKTGIAARSIVVGMTSTGFTINDPMDALGLDVVGFDTAVPALIADFIRG